MAPTDLTRAHRDYWDLGRKMATRSLQTHLFPLLQQNGFLQGASAKDWWPIPKKPPRDPSDLSQMLVPGEAPEIVFILNNWDVYELTSWLIVKALDDAFVRNAQIESNPFIGAILRDLMSGDDSILKQAGVLDD